MYNVIACGATVIVRTYYKVVPIAALFALIGCTPAVPKVSIEQAHEFAQRSAATAEVAPPRSIDDLRFVLQGYSPLPRPTCDETRRQEAADLAAAASAVASGSRGEGIKVLMVAADYALSVGDAAGATVALEGAIGRLPTRNRLDKAAFMALLVRAHVMAGDLNAASDARNRMRNEFGQVGYGDAGDRIKRDVYNGLVDAALAAALGDNASAAASYDRALALQSPAALVHGRWIHVYRSVIRSAMARAMVREGLLLGSEAKARLAFYSANDSGLSLPRGPTGAKAAGLTALSESLAAQGRVSDAFELAQAAVTVIDQGCLPAGSTVALDALDLLGSLLVLAGDDSGALAAFARRDAERTAAPAQSLPPQRINPDQAIALLRQGKNSQAERYCTLYRGRCGLSTRHCWRLPLPTPLERASRRYRRSSRVG